MKFRYDKESEKLIVTDSTRIEYHQMNLWFTRKVKNFRYNPKVKMGLWDGSVNHFKSGKLNLGLWKEALRGCQEIDAKFQIENKEDFPINRTVTLESVDEFCKTFFSKHTIKIDGKDVKFMPYEHQIDAAYKILKNRFCMAEVATSGGKSLIISIVIFYTLRYLNPNAKFLIIVPSITLVTQFYDDLFKAYYGENNIHNLCDDYYLEVETKNNNILKFDTIDKLKTKRSDSLIAKDLNDKDILIDNNGKSMAIKRISKIKIEREIKVEEIMSERPRKYTGSEDANIFIGTYQSLEKWPKEFFKQFHTVITDEAHCAGAKTVSTILESTFNNAYSRFGVSGTFPGEDTCESLTLQSLLGPKITEVSADELKKKGIITPMFIKSVILNHNDKDFLDKMKIVRKAGDGKTAFDLEKHYTHQSEKRLEFIKKLVDKCSGNTLVLFHTIENGQKIFNKLSSEINNKEFYYIDGEVSGRKREEIKKQMEITKNKIEYTILNFGDYEIEVKSDFKILLSNGSYKNASDIDLDDDIDDKFISKLRGN